MYRWLLTAMASTALAWACPAGLFAAEKAGHAKEIGVDHGLFVGALELSLWTILIFLILLWVLRKYAWGPILEGLKQREKGIALDKFEAENARKLAAEAQAKAAADLARTQAEITQLIAKAHQDAQATAAEEIARGKAELQAERDRLRREMEVARDQALKAVFEQGVQLATLIAIKAVGKQITIDDQRGLLNESLAEFRAAGQSRVEDLKSARA